MTVERSDNNLERLAIVRLRPTTDSQAQPEVDERSLAMWGLMVKRGMGL